MIPANVRSMLYLDPVNQRGRSARLLIRPVRESHQCRQDYLMQLAELNALGSLRDLLQSYGVSFASLVVLDDNEIHRFFEGELVLKARNTRSVSYIKAFGLGLPSKICLDCLRKNMVAPHYFNYALSLTCPIHDIVLLDTCEACECPILYTRKHRLRCGRCQYIFLDSNPIQSPDWTREFRRRFSPSLELGFCSMKSHSDMAIARLLMWHYCPGKYRSKYNYPYLRRRHHLWLEQATYMSDSLIEKIVGEFRMKHHKHLNDLMSWTRYPTSANSIIQRVLAEMTKV